MKPSIPHITFLAWSFLQHRETVYFNIKLKADLLLPILRCDFYPIQQSVEVRKDFILSVFDSDQNDFQVRFLFLFLFFFTEVIALQWDWLCERISVKSWFFAEVQSLFSACPSPHPHHMTMTASLMLSLAVPHDSWSHRDFFLFWLSKLAHLLCWLWRISLASFVNSFISLK